MGPYKTYNSAQWHRCVFLFRTVERLKTASSISKETQYTDINPVANRK